MFYRSKKKKKTNQKRMSKFKSIFLCFTVKFNSGLSIGKPKKKKCVRRENNYSDVANANLFDNFG